MILILFSVLRFFNLSADFPLGVTGDLAIYKDEGYYSQNAIAQVLTGDWYVDGGLNFAIFSPINQLIEVVAFELFGVNIVVARVVNLLFFLLLISGIYLLLNGHADKKVALIGTSVLAVNFVVFAYSRVVLLHLPMVSLLLISVYFAAKKSKKKELLHTALSALFFILAFLVKTTAISALPVLLFSIYKQKNYQKERMANFLIFFLVTILLYMGYSYALVGRYSLDYEYLKSISVEDKLVTSIGDFFRIIVMVIYRLHWLGVAFAALVVASLLYGLKNFKQFKGDFLCQGSLIWIVCYLGVLGISVYAPPRYYLPLMPALVICIAVVCREALFKNKKSVVEYLLIIVFVCYLGLNIVRVGEYLFWPKYSYYEMTKGVEEIIAEDSEDRAVLIGDSSSQIALYTGLEFVNMFGVRDLRYRIEKYDPNYFIDYGKRRREHRLILQEYYQLKKLASFDVFENHYTGQPFTLYKLEKKGE